MASLASIASGGNSDVLLLHNSVYQHYGRMVGLLILKQLENLSNERVVCNPYYPYFCGYSTYISDVPCNASEGLFVYNYY
jgi:hypothetical protein